MKEKKFTYQELVKKLAVAEKTITELNQKLTTVSGKGNISTLDAQSAEERANDAEQNLHKLLDASSLGIAIYTFTDEMIYANKALLNFCGYDSIKQITSESIQRFYTPESYQMYLERAAKRKLGQPVTPEYEIKVKRLDGAIVSVRVIFNEVIWGGQRMEMATFVDITEQKTAEEALKISEEKFAKAFRSSPLLVTISTLEDGVIIETNDALLKRSGYSYEEIIGHSSTELNLWTKEDRLKMVQILKEKGRVQNEIFQFRAKSGETGFVDFSAEPIEIGGKKCLISVLLEITERIKMEESLRQQAQIMKQVQDIIITTDMKGQVLSWNRGAEEIFGYSAAEVSGKQISFLSATNQFGELSKHQNVGLGLEKGTHASDVEVITRSGERKNIHLSFTPIIDSKGNTIMICGFGIDITNQKRMENALKESEEKFAKAFRSSPEPFIITEIESGVIIDANEAVLRTTGYTYQEMIGRTVFDLKLWVNPDERKRIQRSLKEKGRINLERIRCRMKSGEIRSFNYSVEPIDVSGKKCMISVLSDITEREKAEEALKESEQKLRSIFSIAPIGIIILAGDTVTEVNQRYCEMLGFSRDEIINRDERGLYIVEEEYERVVSERDSQFSRSNAATIETQLRRKDNTIIDVILSFKPIVHTDITQGLIVTCMDITERKKIEKELRESENKYALAFRSSPQAVTITTYEDAIIIDTNETALRYTGYSYDEVIGHSVYELGLWANPEDGKRMKQMLEEHGQVYREKFKFRIKNGDIRIWEFSAEPIEIGGTKCLISVQSDVTDRIKADEAILARDRTIRSIYSAAPIGIGMAYEDRLIEVNEEYCKIVGYSRDELIGQRTYMVFPNVEEHDYVGSTLLRQVSTTGYGIVETHFKHKNGKILDISLSCAALDADDLDKGAVFTVTDITAQKNAQEALYERDKKIRNIFSVIPIGIGMVSEDIIVEINEGYCNIVGYKRNELLGQKTRMLFLNDEEHNRVGSTLVQQVMFSGYGNIETRFKHKKGHILDIILTCAPMDKTDLAKGVVFAVTDITERNKADEALKQSEERFRTLFETMTQGVVYQDINGRITLANQAAQQILGLTLQEMQGRTSQDGRWRSLHDDGSEFPGEQHPAMIALRTGKPVKDVVMGVYNPVDKDYRWLIMDAIPEFKKGEKKPFRVYAQFRDNTIRRQLEEKIRYQANLIQTVSDAIVSSDENYKLVSWNKAAEELYGWKEEEVIGKNIMEVLKAELSVPIKEMQAVIDKRGYWKGESVHYTRDGRRMDILESVSIRRDTYGNNVGAVTVFKDITERKQMEESIRYHASLIENTLDPIISTDNEYKILSWNKAATELYGWTKEELLGKDVRTILKPVIVNVAPEKVDMSLDEMGYWNGEAIHQRKDGSKLNVLESISIRRDAQGKNIGAVGVFKDITQRKKMEESLRYYAELVESVSDAVVSVDSAKRLISWNKAGEKLFGWSREEVLGEVITEFLPSSFLGTSIESMEEILGKQGQWSGEGIHYRKDGKKIATLESISLTKDENGAIRGSVVIFKDITESKNMAEALANENTIKRLLVEQSRDGIVILEQDGKVHEANRRFIEMLGYSPEEIHNLHVWDWDTQWSKERLLEMIDTVTESGDHFETYHRRKDGTTFDVEISSNGATFAGQKLVFCVCRDITERKRMEERIRYHASLVENVSDAVVSSDLNYKILSWNKAAEKTYGWTEREALGKSVMEITKPVFINTSKDEILFNLRKNGSWRGEATHHRQDGKPINVLISISLMRDQQGKETGAVTIFTDITERKLAEEKHETILKTALDGFHILDMEGNILEVNDSYCQMSGYTRDELLKMRINDVEANKGTGPLTRIGKMPEKGGDRFETQHVCKDGRIIDLEVTLNYMNIGDGQIFSFLHDITERKRNEERINLLNTTLRSIRNVNQLITREKDRSDLIQGVCDALVQSRSKIKSWIALFDKSQNLISYTAAGEGKNFNLIVDLLKQHKFPQCVDKAMLQNKSLVTKAHDSRCKGCILAHDTSDYGSITIKLCYGDRTYGVLGVSAPTNIVSDKDEVELYEEVATDIAFALYNIDLEAEHEFLEQERLRVAKLESIGTLAGGIAHDFNNLLTGILGNIGMAKLNIKPAEHAYELLDEAEKATIRTRDLTQQLLTFSKGGMPVKKIVDIRSLIKETATFALRGSRVKLELSLPTKLWQIEADEGQISQVIHNLVINADEAMPDGGILNIDAANTKVDKVMAFPLKPGNYVVINVKDTGIGMTSEQLKRVFEPYYTTKQGGSGLGLTSAFSIIRNHNGYIYAESVPNKGSTFRVYLPASKQKKKGGRKMTAAISGKAGGRILVMDDEPIIQRMLKKMLILLGYEVAITGDGTAAINQYVQDLDAGKPFDAVIMDLTIPGGMGGKEAVKKILEKDPAAKVIVSSGYATDPIMSEYEKYGFSAVVNKPYTINQLQETLRGIRKKKK